MKCAGSIFICCYYCASGDAVHRRDRDNGNRPAIVLPIMTHVHERLHHADLIGRRRII